MKKSLLIILLVWACVLALTACGGETHTHVFDTEEVLVAPTCTENGMKSCYCDCGVNQVRKIEATGHTYSEWTLNDDESKLVISCLNCGMIIDSIDNIKDSKGLEFRLNADGKSYSVTGIGICNDTDIVIPSVYNGLPVTIIGDSAFSSCHSLTSVVIPDGVTSIGDSVFSHCDSLTSIEIPDSVTSIGDYAFSYCYSLKSIKIPDSVTSIGDYAFCLCYSLTSIEIPDSVTSIGDFAFLNCVSLTSVVIPNSVTSIDYGAFSGCNSMTSIEIPDSVTSIGDYAFSYCYSLKSINVSENNKNYKSIDGNLYSKDGTTLIQYAMGKTDASFTIPDGVTSIGDFAFYACDSLTSVVIPDSVTSIGDYAFEDCDSLTSIEIPDSVTSIGDSAFYDCDSMTSIEIPDSVTIIGYGAFSSCDSLTSVVIPDGVTSIGRYAFDGCDSLTIYCEATSQPSGWNSYWNSDNCPVVWGYTEN